MLLLFNILPAFSHTFILPKKMTEGKKNLSRIDTGSDVMYPIFQDKAWIEITPDVAEILQPAGSEFYSHGSQPRLSD